MATLEIDGRTFDLDELTAEAKAQIQSLQATDQKIMEANQTLAILQTARNAYALALKELLPDADMAEH